MDWISFDEQRPHDSQRCLVCYKPWERVIVLTYNFIHDCWDDDEGDQGQSQPGYGQQTSQRTFIDG